MDDSFYVNTDEMKRIANAIKTNTDQLEQQTNTLMDRLDAIYLNFPPGAANLAQESQISLTAVFKRVRVEDSRISQILQAIALAVEEQEKKMVETFTLLTGD